MLECSAGKTGRPELLVSRHTRAFPKNADRDERDGDRSITCRSRIVQLSGMGSGRSFLGTGGSSALDVVSRSRYAGGAITARGTAHGRARGPADGSRYVKRGNATSAAVAGGFDMLPVSAAGASAKQRK